MCASVSYRSYKRKRKRELSCSCKPSMQRLISHEAQCTAAGFSLQTSHVGGGATGATTEAVTVAGAAAVGVIGVSAPFARAFFPAAASAFSLAAARAAAASKDKSKKVTKGQDTTLLELGSYTAAPFRL